MEVGLRTVLNRRDTYPKADLPTVKHVPGPRRQCTTLVDTLPAHQGRTRGSVALQAASLRQIVTSRRTARLVRQEPVLVPPATLTELAMALLVTASLSLGLTAPTRLRRSRRPSNARLVLDPEAEDSPPMNTSLQRRTSTGIQDSPKE
jgi:hypothetical protein